MHAFEGLHFGMPLIFAFGIRPLVQRCDISSEACVRVQKMGQEEVTSIEGVVVLLKEVKEACENKPSLRLDAGRQILTSLGLGERLSRKYAMIAGLGSEEVENR